MIKIINSLCNFCNEYLFQYAKQKLLLWNRGCPKQLKNDERKSVSSRAQKILLDS